MATVRRTESVRHWEPVQPHKEYLVLFQAQALHVQQGDVGGISQSNEGDKQVAQIGLRCRRVREAEGIDETEQRIEANLVSYAGTRIRSKGHAATKYRQERTTRCRNLM